MTKHTTVVGVFGSHAQAQQAVDELRKAGFTDDQIGVTARDHSKRSATGDADNDADSYASEGALTGLAAGAGVGGLWGLGILAGVLPAIGPAIAAGSLAALLSSAAAGAAAAGLAGTLVGLGIAKEDAEYYETEVRSGRILVTVQTQSRGAEANTIMRRCGGYDMTNRTAGDVTSSRVVLSDSDRFAGATHAREPGAVRTGTDTDAVRDEPTVQARQEELHVHKQPVKTGEAGLHKEVHAEHKVVDVPVQREELVIDRHPAARHVDSRPMGEAQEIRIPISEEQISVGKETVTKEKRSIGKRGIQGTQHVDETLRKEEIEVDTEGNARGSRWSI